MKTRFQFVLRNEFGDELERSDPMTLSGENDSPNAQSALAEFIKNTPDIYVGDSITIQRLDE